MWFLLFQGLLVGLKVKGKVQWQWRWVLLPTWGAVAWVVVLLAISAIEGAS